MSGVMEVLPVAYLGHCKMEWDLKIKIRIDCVKWDCHGDTIVFAYESHIRISCQFGELWIDDIATNAFLLNDQSYQYQSLFV